MNGSSSVSTAQSARIKSEPDDWTKEDCLTLLERIRNLLPDGDAMKYKTTESHFDWEKVCFGSFTGDMCRQKWQKVSTELSCREDHPELIEERKKSDLPEKPKTPQQLWYNHEKKTYMKLHPEVSQKELKEALRRQWSQLSDKRRLKWISKALELQKDYEDSMRAYHEAHPDVNSDDHVRSVLTKAERQLKDKFDGRPTKPPPNRSKQKQKQTEYDIDLQRFLESLPEEERDRVLTEEKLGGSRLGGGVAASPHRAKSPSVKERCREAEPEPWVPAGTPKERRDGKKTAKLPETPKTAEEMWQHSVIGDYLAKYRSDRRKAQAAMEAAWKSMEKKEKIPWIKKAAEDQKRYEVQYQPVVSEPRPSPTLTPPQESPALTLQVTGSVSTCLFVCLVLGQKRRSTTKARSSPGAKVRVTAKGKAVGSRAATPGVGVGKRAMAYRAKVTHYTTEQHNDDEDDEDDEDQTSSEESSDSDSD
uniref:Upstream binding transcription factor, like n=1 Tax=Seriola lalandi dorsalis TaxID=1841481 RepID=A0A3B4WXZ1_SERLL